MVIPLSRRSISFEKKPQSILQQFQGRSQDNHVPKQPEIEPFVRPETEYFQPNLSSPRDGRKSLLGGSVTSPPTIPTPYETLPSMITTQFLKAIHRKNEESTEEEELKPLRVRPKKNQK
jgi:hypothetical protein